MSWFNASQLSSFAKQALSQAQKSIDRVLDIQEEEPSAWVETIPYGEPGISSPVSGGWDTSTWGLKSNTEPQSPPTASPKAITKPVRRTVVDESENFFSAFLSSTDVQTIQKSPVQDALSPKTEGQPEETVNKEPERKVPTIHLKVSESTTNVKTTTETVSAVSTHSLTAETKVVALEPKEQKHEDRQSNTPSPPVSTFSSGTSTTSDIEVLDHDSVISESSASSRQETTDAKSSLHLMQTSFQLLSASACPEYNRLDDFQKLNESCGSSDAFERIDSFSVQSLDSRSVSEINSDDELPGKGYALVPIIVNPSTPKTKIVESIGGKPEEEVNETLSIPAEEAEMEESGRSATPVNCEQPDTLVSSTPMNEGHVVLDKVVEQCEAAESPPEALCEKKDVCKTVELLNERLEKREAQLLSLSKEKALLEEAYDNLKDELFRVKEESSSISSLKDEFTQRIAEAEKKVQLACKERDAAKKVLDGKEEVEKQHRENIKKLNSVVDRQEKDLGRLQIDMDELEEKNRSIQAALDSAYKELTDLHKASAAKDSEAQEAALSREMKAKEELSAAVEKAQEEARQQQETLAIQVGDLRLALQRAEQAAARKEDYLRHEISELQQRLQEAENRNQELSQSVSSTTRPLLRQIENLQATLGSQTSSWEKLEKNLSDRLGESQTLLAAAVERERAATEELLANKIQMSSMESQNSLLRQENSRLQAQLESEKNKLRKLEDENNRYQVELENLKDEYVRTLEETRKEKLEIGNLEKTRSIMAEELVKLTNQNDELEEKVKEIPKLRIQLRDLDQRYNTILQMYGEKAEEAEELRLDLEDVKNMYKTQIDELLRQRLS
ncbi:TATA element modulatory factor [Heterocephalus glaber]|uniref:TATA element modulatory factor n=1 Tax=Heterocephalus glaber TaxID=10181 RepID=G5AVQ7_HETGA|nr:TATA element modulatory factor [Heterocephalus glaber]